MFGKLIDSVRFMHAFTRLIEDPTRLDLVFELTRRALSGSTLPPRLARPEVIEYVRAPKKPQPLHVDLEALSRLPQGTLGRSFADWYTAQGFTPGDLLKYDQPHNQPHNQIDTEVVRYRLHIQSTHDLWHVLTGFDTDVEGEIGLQTFNLAQLDSPLALVTIAAAALHVLRKQADASSLLEAITRGWRMGKAARPMFGVDWASLWSTPLDEVRARYGLTPSSAVPADAPAPAQAA
jgi:ubiquinone biosynthesis protein COQ4